jgi:16S rRNA processing protein RimM
LSGPPSTAEQWVWLAIIRHTQGRKGEVFADILTDFPEKFSERKKLWLLRSNSTSSAGSGTSGAGSGAGGPARGDVGRVSPTSAVAKSALDAGPREVELAAFWLHKGGIVLHFAGVDSISAAETLAGLVVAVPHAQRALLAEDEVHIADLIGCTVFDVSGSEPLEIGPIENVDRSAGPVPLLIVQGAKGELLIPFAKSYMRKLDVAGRRVEMALPEGLTDL